jgi:hypothetical protein
LRGDVSGELLVVEAGVAPGDVPVVHLVRDAEGPEAAEEVLIDALDEVAAVDEVLLAQGQEVAPVGAFRGGAIAKASRGKRSRGAARPRVWIDAKRTSASASRCWPV